MERNHFKPRRNDRAAKIASLFIDRVSSGTELLCVGALWLQCLFVKYFSFLIGIEKKNSENTFIS